MPRDSMSSVLIWFSSRSFSEMISTFELKVPAARIETFQQLLESNASAAEIERSVQAMTGDLGFVRFAAVNQGPLVSSLGRTKRISVYLLGNPVLANRMFERRPEVGLYAPLRACVFEDYVGVSHFT